MIERPEELETVEVDVQFNFQKFEFLEIDLKHINKNGRSNLSVLEVTEMVLGLINNRNLSPSGEKAFGDEMCSYFVRSGKRDGKKLKLVFCICSDRPTTIGVITLHRI